MIRITQRGTICSYSPAEIEQLRRRFARDHQVVLPQLLSPEILKVVLADLERASFKMGGGEHTFYSELRLDDPTIMARLHFMVNDPKLFEFVEQITGCAAIGCYVGRVYRRLPVPGHFDSWHDDLDGHRMITMSINLSTEIFQGGELLLRDAATKQLLGKVANTGFGDALLFRIAKSLHHKVTPVEGSAARTALAGWFRDQPNHFSVYQEEPAYAHAH